MERYFFILAPLITICANVEYFTHNRTFDENIEFDYTLTTDDRFCSADSVIGTDCGGGKIYFTKKGNVFYNFFCMGADTVSYLIGTYEVKDRSIKCIFNKKYKYFDGEYGLTLDGKPIDPNNGKFYKMEIISLELRRIDCEKYDYEFTSIQGEKYVLRKSGKDEVYFPKMISKIKAMSKLYY